MYLCPQHRFFIFVYRKMSADSPRRSGGRVNRQGGGAVSGNGGGLVVAPQPVTDPSIIDSVTGFINDVVPQVRLTEAVHVM